MKRSTVEKKNKSIWARIMLLVSMFETKNVDSDTAYRRAVHQAANVANPKFMLGGKNRMAQRAKAKRKNIQLHPTASSRIKEGKMKWESWIPAICSIGLLVLFTVGLINRGFICLGILVAVFTFFFLVLAYILRPWKR